jgi:cytochrome o ubiquinol oxidase subunit II
MKPTLRTLALMSGLALTALLAGCDMVVMDPSGDVAARQRDLLVISTLLMLLIIVPVMALTVWFAFKYRHNNKQARYEPDWHHSMRLELVIWSAPLLIIICLGAITWLGTHLLDPFRKLDRLDQQRPLTTETRELVVNVVALDWKWLFIYPQQGIATVNEFVVPVDQPVSLRITASSVMNAFYVPELAGMIYAMPGMQTQLHAIMNKELTSEGFSANYSGHGFSGMRFAVRSVSRAEFEKWAASAKQGTESLSRERYLELAKPSMREPVRRFAQVQDRLFDYVLGDCVQSGRMCSHDMAQIDRRGGLGLASIYNVAQGPDGPYLVGQCRLPQSTPLDDVLVPRDRTPLIGAGLSLPRSEVPTPLLAGQ